MPTPTPSHSQPDKTDEREANPAQPTPNRAEEALESRRGLNWGGGSERAIGEPEYDLPDLDVREADAGTGRPGHLASREDEELERERRDAYEELPPVTDQPPPKR